MAAGAALPLCQVLSGILENSDLDRGYVLLNTAVFPTAEGDSQADLGLAGISFLQELDELLQSQPLANNSPAWSSSGATLPVLNLGMYLFDCRKEGSYVVRD